MVRFSDFEIEKRTVFGDIGRAYEVLLLPAFSGSLDNSDSIWSSFVSRHLVIVGREPLVSLLRFDLKRREENVLIMDCFAVDPGIRVVELEHINAPPYSNNAA